MSETIVNLDSEVNEINNTWGKSPTSIAKRHDIDYAPISKREDYAGYLEDVRTLQADKDMVQRIDDFQNPFKSVEGIDEPLQKSFTTENAGSIAGQKLLISSLATYKQWKVDNKLGNDDLFKDNKYAFALSHSVKTVILSQTPEAKKQNDNTSPKSKGKLQNKKNEVLCSNNFILSFHDKLLGGEVCCNNKRLCN